MQEGLELPRIVSVGERELPKEAQRVLGRVGECVTADVAGATRVLEPPPLECAQVASAALALPLSGARLVALLDAAEDLLRRAVDRLVAPRRSTQPPG